jgi:hypothetical protein
MKTLFARMVFMCAVASLCSSAVAQITITAANVSDRFQVGRKVVRNDDTLTTSVNIGAPGPTSWDFSGLLKHATTTATSIAKPAPFDTAFPGATHVLKTSLSGVVNVSGITATVRGDLYLYWTLGSTLQQPGTYGTGIASAVLSPGFPPTDIPGTVKIANSPADLTYPLPLTLGTSWKSTYAATQTVALSIPFPITPTVTNYDISYTVDAYGPMKIPGGGVYDALRIRKVDRAGTTRVGYLFLTVKGASVEFTAADTSAPSSGTIAINRKSVAWNGPVAVGVEPTASLPAEFALQQNYPNPFNPSTTITFQLAKAGFVSLKVYDLLGQEVTTLVNENKAPGTYTVDWLAGRVPSGIYFCRMQSGSFTATRSMMLMK